MKIKSILTIAGSDSSSGAGIQADSAVARSLGVFPFCAVTCITSQGKSGVRRIQVVDPEIFRDQLTVAFEEYQPDAVKIGLLPSSLKPILLKELVKFKPKNVVLDPILSPTLMASEVDKIPLGWTCDELKEYAPYITLLTPNMVEAFDILDLKFPEVADSSEVGFEEIAKLISLTLPFPYILLKGGHAPKENRITDLLISINKQDEETEFFAVNHPLIHTLNTHGTGCSLSAAIASELALGASDMRSVVTKAIDHIQKSMKEFARTKFFNDPEMHGPAFFI